MDHNNEENPAELIVRAREGSNGARGSLLEMYRHYVQLLARMQLDERLKGKIDPSDLVQEIFMRAQRGFGEFRGQSEPELLVWLRRILGRALANQLRHYQGTGKRNIFYERNLDDVLDHSSAQMSRAVVSRDLSPSAQARRREQAVLVADALEQLPEHYREVIVLRRLRGLSFPEVARQMDRTVDSVKYLWSVALVRLRQELSGELPNFNG